MESTMANQQEQGGSRQPQQQGDKSQQGRKQQQQDKGGRLEQRNDRLKPGGDRMSERFDPDRDMNQGRDPRQQR
jgi:hypothetical protein